MGYPASGQWRGNPTIHVEHAGLVGRLSIIITVNCHGISPSRRSRAQFCMSPLRMITTVVREMRARRWSWRVALHTSACSYLIDERRGLGARRRSVPERRPRLSTPDRVADLVVQDALVSGASRAGRYKVWQLNAFGFRGPKSRGVEAWVYSRHHAWRVRKRLGCRVTGTRVPRRNWRLPFGNLGATRSSMRQFSV
jgi:hypothetical protein